MGITHFSKQLIDKYVKPGDKVLELGAQNLYFEGIYYGKYASEYYANELHVSDYQCIDLNGENSAIQTDLGTLCMIGFYDIVTDFGTSEHVGLNGKFNFESFVNCIINKLTLVKESGIIISENPKTNNWPGHGFNYYTQEFYQYLAEQLPDSIEILEIGEVGAMGNTIDGMNVYCVMKINTKFNANDIEQLTLVLKNCPICQS